MSTFNDESMILKYFKDVSNNEIAIFGNLFICKHIIYSLRWEINKRKWKNSSGKNDPPPDFYNDKQKLMMDVMRIDDCAYVDGKGKVQNKSLQREGELYKEYFKDIDRKDLQILIVPNTKLPTNEDHNFKRYYDNFVRVFKEHESKLDLYKSNHPGYKTIFFIFDESSAYCEASDMKDVKREKHEGMKTSEVKAHLFCYDKEFVKIIKESEVDYVIWFAPFKLIQAEGIGIFPLPKCAVYDVKHIKDAELFEYNHKMMISSEE